MISNRKKFDRPLLPVKCKGISLIELMISMLLGLVLVGAISSVVLANIETFKTNQTLAEVQDRARLTFEILAREIREAGSTGCAPDEPLESFLTNTPIPWWAGDSWNDSLTLYAANEVSPAIAFGDNVGNRINGTSALMIRRMGDEPWIVTERLTSGFRVFSDVSTSEHDVRVGDAILTCDARGVALFNAVAPTGTNKKSIFYDASLNLSGYTLPMIGFLHAETWYVGHSSNNPSGRSLFRARLTGSNIVTDEVVPGVTQFNVRRWSGNSNVIEMAFGLESISHPSQRIERALMSAADFCTEVGSQGFCYTIARRN
ncbi:hypothetical protein DN062_13715 [Nitrincola tibetensis]|uniref:Pilus assembly protein PilW n=1 Tax=Nitrincola tibetensis TaxID=2219697 RepID=A0A364NJH7_9GAMM|nr:prepilin-type N-terminal cleavage/methylation domain-containing protein [Nitrincola tibetensis]RAU17222.1 hypothetical protein DN062_13715 [Nitrincola tibetensis]